MSSRVLRQRSTSNQEVADRGRLVAKRVPKSRPWPVQLPRKDTDAGVCASWRIRRWSWNSLSIFLTMRWGRFSKKRTQTALKTHVVLGQVDSLLSMADGSDSALIPTTL